MSLQRFCKRPIVKIAPEKSIREACQLLEERNVGCLVVEEHGKLCGILTDRDIALRVVGQEKDPQLTHVGTIMTADPVRIPVDSTVHDPHWPRPQPNLVPVKPRLSRSTQSSGMSGLTSTS